MKNYQKITISGLLGAASALATPVGDPVDVILQSLNPIGYAASLNGTEAIIVPYDPVTAWFGQGMEDDAFGTDLVGQFGYGRHADDPNFMADYQTVAGLTVIASQPGLSDDSYADLDEDLINVFHPGTYEDTVPMDDYLALAQVQDTSLVYFFEDKNGGDAISGFAWEDPPLSESAIPEPQYLASAGLGLLVIGFSRRRRSLKLS